MQSDPGVGAGGLWQDDARRSVVGPADPHAPASTWLLLDDDEPVRFMRFSLQPCSAL
ncbi:MAG: hypothetical protein MI924_11285 [Chloroflexales bacterium]|nr:hypothetical protein [Chloroflexales bacterium]